MAREGLSPFGQTSVQLMIERQRNTAPCESPRATPLGAPQGGTAFAAGSGQHPVHKEIPNYSNAA